MDHDTSDILGQKPRLRTDANRPSAFSFSMTQAVYTAIIIVGLIVVARRVWKRVLLWREQSYKLATRRRHGIPDSDQRPFNVAYAEAMLRTRDEQSKRPPRPRPFRPQVSQLDQGQALQEQQILRNRTAAPPQSDFNRHPSILPVPGRFSAGAYDTTFRTYAGNGYPIVSGVNGYAPNGHMHEAEYPSEDERKQGSDEERENEHEVLQPRVETNGMVHGDEEAEVKDSPPKRGSKRGIHDDENDDSLHLKKSTGKRARKVSQNHDMDVDDEEMDEITELKSTTRGKKRDRAEAGSTFGGDDEDSGGEVDADTKARKHRKRRTVAKRKSEASYARGKKRDRDDEEDSNDNISEDSLPGKKPSHKKGKRTYKGGLLDKGSKGDVSMDESVSSTTSKVRSIGDEWESNGIRYKIGPNGQRLRQALVIKARPKFVMPEDSVHPDRGTYVQVYVETWLTEQEYQEQKAQQTLAWQDLPPERERKKPLSLDISASPVSHAPAGKNLLWSSTTTTPTSSPGPQSPPPESLRYRGARHSIATAGPMSFDPFNYSHLPSYPTKRISSNTRAMMLNGSPGLSDSTNGSPRSQIKVYSKWEKQELEAQALMRIREANKKKEMEKEAKLKEEKDRADRIAAEQQRIQQERLDRERAEKERVEREKAERERVEAERKKKEEAAKAAVPNITVTAPSGQPGQTPTPATNGPVPNNLFSIPSAPTAPASSPFSFTKPPQPTGAQPTPAPSLFGKPTQSSSTPAQPPSTGFSFNPSGTSAAPSTSSSFFAPPTKKEEPSTNASQGSSLLSRMGPQVPEAPKTQSQPTTTPLFSFPKADSSSSAGATQSTAQPAPTAAPAPSTGGSALKFNFGVPNKTTTPTPVINATAAPANASTSTPSSLTGALGPEPPKAASSTPASNPIFSFKTPTTPASAMTNSAAGGAPSTTPASTTPATAPKFSFGQSAFAPQTSSSSSATSSAQNKEPVKSVFGNTTTNTTSAFGNASSSTPVFGNVGSTTPAFGNTGSSTSAFGNAGSTTSTFGNTGSTTSAFGNTGSATSAFGKTDSSTPAFGNSNTNSAPSFGSTSTPSSMFGKPSAFGNASGSGPSPFGATAAQTSSVFGGSSAGNAAAGTKPADENSAAPKLTFNFGNTSSTPASTNATGSESKTAFPSAVPSTPAGTTTTPASTPANAFSFNFGKPSSTTPASSPFGAPAAGQSAFGNLGGSTPSVFGSTSFGAPAPQSK